MASDKEWIVFWSEARKRFQLKYKTPKGWKSKSIPKAIPTKKAAEFWAEQWLAGERAKGHLAAEASSPLGPTVAEKKDAWIALRKSRDLSPSTSKDNASHFTVHIVPGLGNLVIGAITPAVVRKFVRDLKATPLKRTGKPPAPLTVHHVVDTLRLFLDDARAEGWAAFVANPARDPGVDVELPKEEPRAGKDVLVVPAASMQAVLDCPDVPGERKVRYLWAAAGGARDGEVAGLTFAKLHLDEPIPHADIDVAVPIKGPKGYATEGRLKNDSSKRKVPLTPALAAALCWWWREGWALTYGRGAPGPNDQVFRGRKRALARPKSAEHLRKDLAAAGQPTHQGPHPFTYHHLRHSCATWLAEAGVDDPTIGALLGHEGKSVTRRSYIKQQLGPLADAAAKIPLRWTGPEGHGTKPGSGVGSGNQDGTKRAPLDHTTPMRIRMVEVVNDVFSEPAEPNARSRSAFLNRRSYVRSVSGALQIKGFGDLLGSIGTKNGTKPAPLVGRSDWALSTLRRAL